MFLVPVCVCTCAPALCPSINKTKTTIYFWRLWKSQLSWSLTGSIAGACGSAGGPWALFSSRRAFPLAPWPLASHQEQPPSRSPGGCEPGLQVKGTQQALSLEMHAPPPCPNPCTAHQLTLPREPPAHQMTKQRQIQPNWKDRVLQATLCHLKKHLKCHASLFFF